MYFYTNFDSIANANVKVKNDRKIWKLSFLSLETPQFQATTFEGFYRNVLHRWKDVLNQFFQSIHTYYFPFIHAQKIECASGSN